jgi:hypothetical protein
MFKNKIMITSANIPGIDLPGKFKKSPKEIFLPKVR